MYDDALKPLKLWKHDAPEPYASFSDGSVHCADGIDLLSQIRTGVADIVFLDPPFNLGKQYGSFSAENDLIAQDVYLTWMKRVLRECVRVVKPGGAVYLYHLPIWATRLAHLLDRKLELRHWIAVSMKNGFVRGKRLYPAHYALLYYTKGAPATFSRPKIPTLLCRHCGKHIRDYGGYAQYVTDGINLSDIWDDISPVRHKKYKTRAANELPIEVLKRIVAISGTAGGLLVDPFVGSGTAAVAARQSGMSFIVGDRERTFCTVTKTRLRQYPGGEREGASHGDKEKETRHSTSKAR